MTVKELIDKLSKLDPDKEISIESEFDRESVKYPITDIIDGSLRSDKLDFQLEGVHDLFNCIGFMGD